MPGQLQLRSDWIATTSILGHTAPRRGASHRPDERDANDSAQHLRDDIEGSALDGDLVRN